MKEKIKMPISFHGNFNISVVEGDTEKKGRCQKLFIKSLPEDYKKDAKVVPTHRVTYFDWGCRYLIEGKLVDNEDDHVSFESLGKVYKFSPAQEEHK
jgi:hypothetical protein